ncbi:hypothetical protein MUO71_05375 [Candidatus Bathyarchaeota archaeon]|nr:hypothetical protein [Candidatus Bathyarchaeota archaeon]
MELAKKGLSGGVGEGVTCWCYAVRKQVKVNGEVVGVRAADLLKIFDCLEVDCRKRGAPDCLIDKVRESRWP